MEQVRELKDACKAVNGRFTLLWHNSQVDSRALQIVVYRLFNSSFLMPEVK
ncbi:hypothetical protein [Pseudomonas cavernae]|uniref:hypothetical protein n=1 Tax=Pseudomonas cavernae TaxID=2320867 RepID=UPI0015AD6F93|nr:hypothetical protein [Pseudomonas cavernae]